MEIFHQRIDDAWNATMKDFLNLVNWKDMDLQGNSTRFDYDRAAGLEEHLRKMGVID